MKPVRGLRGAVGPASLQPTRDPQDITTPDGINPAVGVAASQVQRVRRRDELFDDVDQPADDFADEPIIVGHTAALAAAQRVSLGDRSLEAFRSADIGALIDRLVATSAAQAAQTVPAVDVLRRLKRLMDLTEGRRNAAHPVAGQAAGQVTSPAAGPLAARDGMKRLPPPARPDVAPNRQLGSESGHKPGGEFAPTSKLDDHRVVERVISAGLKINPSVASAPAPPTATPRPAKDRVR